MTTVATTDNDLARGTATSFRRADHAHNLRKTPRRPRRRDDSPSSHNNQKNTPRRYTLVLKPVRFEAADAVRHAPDQLPKRPVYHYDLLAFLSPLVPQTFHIICFFFSSQRRSQFRLKSTAPLSTPFLFSLQTIFLSICFLFSLQLRP